MLADGRLATFGRTANFSLAVVECWLIGGAGIIGLMVGSGLPLFPDGGGQPNLSDIGAALFLLLLAVPGAIGLLVMSKPEFPRRAEVMWLSGILMVIVAVFCIFALANGWHL